MKTNIAIASLFGYLSGIIGTLTSFIAVPLVLKLLGQEQYGFFIVINSITQYLSLSKLGFAAALQNKISELYSKKDYREVNNYISSFYYLFILLFLFLGIFSYFIIVNDIINFNFLFKEKGELSLEEKYIIIIVIVNSLFNLFINSTLSDIFKGVNKVVLDSKISMQTSIISSLLYIIYLYFYVDSLRDIVLFNMISSFAIFYYKFYILKKNIKFLNFNFHIDFSKILDLKTSSFYFFLVSIISIGLGTLDKIYISTLIGSKEVFMYYLLYRLYQIPLKLGSFDDHAWPSFAILYKNKDIVAIENLFNFLIRMNLITKIIPLFIIFIFSSQIIKLWTGDIDNFYGYSLSFILFLIFTLGSFFRTSLVYINATTNQKNNFLIQLVTLILFSLFVFIFYSNSKNFSVVYIALSYLLSQLTYIYFYYFIYNDISINLFNKILKSSIKFIPYIIFLLIVFEYKIYVNDYLLIFLIGMFYIVYVYFFILNEEEKSKIKRRIKK